MKKRTKPSTCVLIENRQRRFKLDAARCAAVAECFIRLSKRVRPAGMAPWESVTLLFVADRGSAEAHRAVFDDPAPTDVITLSYEPEPGVTDGLSGELIVNVERAFQEGSRRASRRPGRWSPDHELALYLAHGVDHLTGADDHEDADFRRMRSRELRWVASAARSIGLSLFR